MSHRDNGAPFRASMSVRVWMRLVRAWLRAVRWCCVLVVASGWLIHSVPAMGSAPGGAPLWSPRGLDRWFVLGGVLLSRTLAGAVPSALSGLASGFGMDTGRFPVAVTTETTTWAVRQRVRVILLSGRLSTHTRVCAWCVWLVVWVGCGPYSGRFALLWLLTPARV